MGYNQGDSYEEIIFNILQKKELLALDSSRAGAGTGADIKFMHRGQEFNLEVKLDLKADYGQKMLTWSNQRWKWCVDDSVTQFYTRIDILNIINNKNIIPNRFIIDKNQIQLHHKQTDQQQFNDYIDISIQALYDYYKLKNCYYIQIGGYGFYHLDRDILDIGTPQFNCDMRLRLRAKTIRSQPIHNYGFYAVLKPKNTKIAKSQYDLEEKSDRIFPLIFK